jgi:hypothetical protein
MADLSSRLYQEKNSSQWSSSIAASPALSSMKTIRNHKQTYYAHADRQRRYLAKYKPRPSESSGPITQPLLHNRLTPTLMTRTCILSAGLTRQSQNLVAGPGKSMCRDGEWSEDKSLGACPKWKLRRCDWVHNRWHSALSVYASESVLLDPW